MSYEKQVWVDGESPLNAERMNHMEDGIAKSISYEAQTLTAAQKAQARNNIGAESSNGDITIPSYWESAVSEAEDMITCYQEDGGVDVFTFGFITDTHTSANSNGNFAKLMQRVMETCKIPICLHGGDYIAGSAIISKADLIAQHLHNDYIFRNIEDKLLTAQGNHEGVYGVTSNYDSNLTNAEIYNYVFRKNQGKHGVVFGDTGTYFYKDIPAQKVRYIVLNCYEFETEMDDAQVVISNNKLRVSKFGAAQLEWLANVALDVPKGYSVVICSHNAPYRVSDLPTAWVSETTFMIDCEVTLGLINAYRNKTSYIYTGSLGSGTTLESYSLDFDFSQRKGEIVCWVAGHTHMDGIFDIDGLKVITTANCSSHIAVTDAPNKVSGTDTEYIMDFFCVNKQTKTCNIVRLGATLEAGTGNTTIVCTNNLADTDNNEWLTDKRLTADASIVDATDYAVSNYFPVTFPSELYFTGWTETTYFVNVAWYNANKELILLHQYGSSGTTDYYTYNENVFCIDLNAMPNPGAPWNNLAYARISGPIAGSLDNVAIAVNEEIRVITNGDAGSRLFAY